VALAELGDNGKEGLTWAQEEDDWLAPVDHVLALATVSGAL
jgi:hypothetical protein